MQNELNKKIGQATKWSSITEIVVKLIAPFTNAVLARLLVPEAFGVVATLTMVVSFAEIFTDAGFQKYIVQHQFEDDADLEISTNVAFSTNLTFSIVLWAVIACFATPITNVVGSVVCEKAVVAMCAQIPLLAFSSIQMARYRRDFDFKSLFVTRMATALVPLVITVPLAFVYRSYWALVVGTLARDFLNAVILTVKSRWKPRICFKLAKLREMLSFSCWTVVENITIWLTNYVGTFIVGTALSTVYLGLYKTTITTVNAYMNLITAATTPVLFSALSRCQDNEKAFSEVFFRFQRMVALVVFPLGFGMYVYRDLATSLLLGSQWMETADFLGLWSLTSSLSIIFCNYSSEVFRSKGKPKLSVLAQILHLAALIPVLLLLVDRGYEVLTVGRSLIRLEMIVVCMLIMRIAIGIRFAQMLMNVWPSLFSSVVMAAVAVGLRRISDHILYQMFSILICCGVYAVLMCLLPGGRRLLFEIPGVNTILKRVNSGRIRAK